MENLLVMFLKMIYQQDILVNVMFFLILKKKFKILQDHHLEMRDHSDCEQLADLEYICQSSLRKNFRHRSMVCN